MITRQRGDEAILPDASSFRVKSIQNSHSEDTMTSSRTNDEFAACSPADALMSPPKGNMQHDTPAPNQALEMQHLPSWSEDQQAAKVRPPVYMGWLAVASQALSIAELHTCPGRPTPDDPPEAIRATTIQG